VNPVSSSPLTNPAAALGECLGARAEAARRLGVAIAAGDAEEALQQHHRLAELATALPDLQRRFGPTLASGAPEVLGLVRALAAEIKNADATVTLALSRAGSASLPLWLLGHGLPTPAGIEMLLAPPWDKNRDLVGLVGTGAWALGRQLIARGQNRVLVVDPAAPEETAPAEESASALWNVTTQGALETAVGSMTWPLPEQLRIVEIGPAPLWTGKDLNDRLLRALEFTSVGKLQLRDEARLFALKASRNLAEITRRPSISALRGALQGLPAVVVSAGPSLDKNIAVLKELAGKVVIVAINQTVAGLRRAGIRADLVVAVEPLNVSYHFDGTRPGDIGTLLLGAGVDPALFRIPCDRMFHFSSSPVVEQWMYDLLGDPDAAVSCDGTVSTGAIKLCAYLGCTTIVSIGRDLALAGDRYYASNAADGGSDPSLSADGKRISFGSHASKLRLANPDDEASQKAIQELLDGQVYDLREVPGHDGRPVKTTNLFVFEIEQLRRTIASLRAHIRFINATEGGAYLEGMEHMSLAEAGRQIAVGPCDVEARIGPRARIAEEAISAQRAAHMAAQLADVARDLRHMGALAHEAIALIAVSGANADQRSRDIGAKLAALSRARPFLSVMIQNATRAIVKKGGPAFSSGDDVAAAERTLYAAITNLVEVLAPQVESAVTTLESVAPSA
jgi:hypothetical protein